MSRAAVTLLAPERPPCFDSRQAWVEYLVSAHDSARNESGPLVGPVDARRFNPQFRFCDDCDARYAMQMRRAGRCNPKHLLTAVEAPHAT